MTLVLLESLVVRVGDFRFSMPGENVLRTLQSRPADTELVDGTPFLQGRRPCRPPGPVGHALRPRPSGRADRT